MGCTYVPLAQLVEHRTFNPVVMGSSPIWHIVSFASKIHELKQQSKIGYQKIFCMCGLIGYDTCLPSRKLRVRSPSHALLYIINIYDEVHIPKNKKMWGFWLTRTNMLKTRPIISMRGNYENKNTSN